MKFRRAVLAVLASLVLPVVAEEGRYAIEFMDVGLDFEFEGVRISAISTSSTESFSPVSSDGGWYTGFSSAPGYVQLSQFTVVDGYEDGWYSTDVVMDPTGILERMFFAELLASNGDVVAYSGYSDYNTVNQARTLLPEGFTPWDVGSFTAAPIPEPSSGLLLLIGGALVGLRRKRRTA